MGKNIAIVGCGGVGSWAAFTVAKAAMGNPELVSSIGLFDADKWEERNFSRAPRLASGHPKARQVRLWLEKETNHTVPIEAHTVAITPDNISVALEPYDTILCCTDDVASQRLIYQWCRSNGRTYRRGGYDGDIINVLSGMPLTCNLEAERADQGYHGQPEVYHAMITGALVAYSALRNPVTVMGELKSLTVTGAAYVPKWLRDDITSDTWKRAARDEGWHDEGDCNHEDCISLHDSDYHSSDDCNHDECFTYESALESFFDKRPRDIVCELPDEVVDYIKESAAEEALADQSAEDAAAKVEAYHIEHHNAAIRESWCPYCER